MDWLKNGPGATERSGGRSGRVFVELPGLRNEQGLSPFWQGLGRHFCPLDPQTAAQRLWRAWRRHVAALLPRDLLLESFLSPGAQEAIGAIPGELESLAAALDHAGFRSAGHVTIDDGGAVLEADLGDLGRVRA